MGNENLNRVNSCVFDLNNRLWIASANGIYITDFKKTSKLNANMGLLSNEVSTLYLDSSNNKMYVGTNNGFSVVNINQYNKQTYDIQISIKSVITTGDTITNFNNYTLSPNQNSLEIYFCNNFYPNKKALKIKYNLDGVHFSLIEYDIPHAKGWALKVENSKVFDLDETLVEIKQVMVDDMFVMHTDNRKTCYLLKSIKEMDGLIKKKVVGSWYGKDNPIKSGGYNDFVLTKNKDGFSYELESHPLKLDIFDNEHLEDYKDKVFPVLFKIEFRAATNINGEKLVFPFKTLYIQENEKGVFEWAKPEFWQ